ncbi:hypothetical protein FKM82_024017 [Ascaphus truei]
MKINVFMYIQIYTHISICTVPVMPGINRWVCVISLHLSTESYILFWPRGDTQCYCIAPFDNPRSDFFGD